MAQTFVERLWSEYPINKAISIFGGDGLERPVVENLDSLIETAVEEVASDVLFTESIYASGMATQLPQSTICVSSARMSDSFPYQGNRVVKCTFEPSTKKAYLRYFPAIISYTRVLTMDDLDPVWATNADGTYKVDAKGKRIVKKPSPLIGDRLRYVKSYVMWKMATKEISVLKSAVLQLDHGVQNLDELERFRDDMKTIIDNLKQDSILLYSSVV